MKFVCDKCNTRYSIADDRVHGRVLKIRCKSCNHVITVREEGGSPSQPMAQVKAAQQEDNNEHTVVSSGPLDVGPLSSPGDGDEWYVSFDGEQEGPLPIARAIERIKVERPRGKEIHCWRPGFFVWLPLEEVPEFMRLLESRPPAQPPRIPITATAKPPPRKDPTGPAKKEPSQTGPRPVVKRDPTGPRAALGVATPVSTVPSLESKPMPLPPPPESAPMAPFAGLDSLPPLGRELGAPEKPAASGSTKPESKSAYRKADGAGMTPSLGAKALADAPAKKPFGDTGKKPALPSLSDSGKRAALPSLGDTGKRPKITDVPMPKPASAPLDEDASPFAAALAAGGGAAAEKLPETGPVPLPPPPEELPIGEASGLLNLSHLAAAAAQAQPRPARPAVETFGGQTVTPPTGSTNGSPSAPQPVVVVAGPAPRGAAPWMKWAAIGGLALSLILGTVLIVVLVRAPKPTVTVAQEPKIEVKQHVDDRPIALVGDQVQPQAPGADGKKPAVVHHAGASKPKQSDARPPGKGATIITGNNPAPSDDDEPGGHALHVGSRGPSGGREVSGPALAQVVNQNQRSLSLCYERVLKHDNTLKKAKVTTKVKVGVSGTVKSVTVEDAEFRNSEIGNCLVATMKNWHFPPNGEEYETEIPLLLQAN